MGRPRVTGRPLKNPVSTNVFICALQYLFAITTVLPEPHPSDNRLFCKVNVEGLQGIYALVDCGATLSGISEDLLKKIPARHKLQKVPISPYLKVSCASGSGIQVVGQFMITVSFPEQDGRVVNRPFYVFRGLANHAMVLGMDFIREQQMVIEADHVFFNTISENHALEAITLRPAADKVLPPKCVMKMTVFPNDAHGRRLKAGTELMAYSSTSNIGVWDSLNKVNEVGHIMCIVQNTTEQPIYVHAKETIGFGEVVTADDEVCEIKEEFLAEMFGSFGKEPPEPDSKPAQCSPEERAYILEHVNIKATSEWTQKYLDLILRYHDTCSKGDFDLGRTGVLKHAIRMKDTEPIHSKQFRIPLEQIELVHDWIDRLAEKGAIEVSRSVYNSPLFLVKKQGGKRWRIVLDYRKINEHSLPDKYTIREVRDCVDEIGMANSCIFSAVDLTSGFWQQELEEESRQYTAFTVPGKGTRYQWTVTPMGLQGSPSSFARLIDYVMRGLKNVICYIDDVLVHSDTHENHLQNLEKVFLRLRKYNLKLNLSKTTFGSDSVTYLGYKLSGEGVSPGPDKLKAVREFPQIDSVKKVREFVGLCNYFRFLIPKYQSYSSQLTKLTKKDSGYEKGPLPKESQEAFEHLKGLLSAEPVVSHPKKGLPYLLRTDACAGDSEHPGGFGAVLSQSHPDGKERVIAYASRALKTYEENYQPYLLELAAAVWAIDHFHVYLRGRRFALYTDHKPLEHMSKIHQKTLNRLQQQLLEYDFTVNYIKGSDNSAADALSRNVAAVIEHRRMLPVNLRDDKQVSHFIESLSDSSGSLLEAQRRDPFIKDVFTHLNGETVTTNQEQYAKKVKRIAQDSLLKDGVVFYHLHRKNAPSTMTLLTPECLREKVLREAHTTWDGGHGGEQRTLDRICQNFYWPGMAADVDRFIKKCLRCQEAKGRKPAPAPLKNLPLCEEPNQRVHADLFGPLKTRSASGNTYILVITDAFTKYTELVALPDKTAESVARAIFERWVCRFSVPQILVTDNGKEFANEILNKLCEYMGTKHNQTSPYHPQSNSSAESYNRQIRKYLTAMLENHETLDWEEWLPALMFSYNTHIHSATRQSPFFLTFLHDPRLPYFDLDKPRTLYGEDYVSHTFSMLQKSHREAQECLAKQAFRAKAYHDQKARARDFKVGQRVMVYFPDPPKGTNKKFFKHWKGPYLVKQLVGNLNLLLQLMESPRAKEVLIHCDRCKIIQSDAELQGFSQKEEPLLIRQGDLDWSQQTEVEEECNDAEANACSEPDQGNDQGVISDEEQPEGGE